MDQESFEKYFRQASRKITDIPYRRYTAPIQWLSVRRLPYAEIYFDQSSVVAIIPAPTHLACSPKRHAAEREDKKNHTNK